MIPLSERTAVAQRSRCVRPTRPPTPAFEREEVRKDDRALNRLLRSGDSLGQYEITERLARHRLGGIFRARHRLLGAQARLVVFHKHTLRSSGLESHVRTRAIVAATLQHPHIVPTTDVFETLDFLVYVQNVDDVVSLNRRLTETGPLPWVDACRIVRNVAAALEYCHQKGIVHLDVCPRNILIGENGGVFLNHFLCSLPFTGGDAATPPEMTAGESPGPSVDIWGLGFTLYSLIAGISPSEAQEQHDIPTGWSDRGFPPIRSVRPDVPEDMDLLLARLLAPVKEQRYRRASEAAEALSVLLEEADQIRMPFALLDSTVSLGPLNEFCLGEYVVSESLGSGSYGDVYKVRRWHGQDVFALKVLKEEFSHSLRHVSRFERECEAMQRIRHPGVVRVFENGRMHGRPYLLMEFIPGLDLRRTIDRDGPMPVGEALRVAARLAEALGVVHEAGVVHRDLKPHNVLLADRGPVITDFGSALVRDTVRCTRTGEIIGSVAYMAPEQLDGGSHGPATDIYALGVVLFQILTGALPFDGDNPYRVIERIRTEPPPRTADHGIPHAELLDDVLEKLLAKDPLDRFPDGKALAGLLGALRSEIAKSTLR